MRKGLMLVCLLAGLTVLSFGSFAADKKEASDKAKTSHWYFTRSIYPSEKDPSSRPTRTRFGPFDTNQECESTRSFFETMSRGSRSEFSKCEEGKK